MAIVWRAGGRGCSNAPRVRTQASSGMLPVEVEGHGREPIFPAIDLTRTVGWFTTLAPVFLDLDPPQGAAHRLQAVRERLRSVPHHGLGWGLLRYLGDGEQRRELELLTRDLGVQDAVRFLGTRQNVPDVLAACDVFSHAAPFEPFGIVSIEAMAMSLPVILPNSGGIRETIDNGRTGLLYPALDYLELANHMALLHYDRARRQIMGEQARAHVEKQFSVTSYVRRLYDFYGAAGQ